MSMPRHRAIAQSQFKQWYDKRLALEQIPYKTTPDGPIRRRWWREIDPALRRLPPLLKLLGLYSPGRANALNISLREVMVELARLPACFDGYRIVQISDSHLDLLPELSGRMATLLTGVSTDLLLLTGDYRDSHKAPPEAGLALLQPVIKAIDIRDGAYALLGNHDPAAAVPILEDMGLTVLLNRTVTMTRPGGALHLTGLDDVHTFYTDAALAALQASHQGCRIAAVHSAEVADLAAEAGIDLYLCGHTHGGQICLPGGHPVVSHLFRCRAFSHGLWRQDDMIGYTSNGAGVSSIPIRFHCPPEIALITLRRAK
ncbi:MAG: metallophosphoesterase [Rhodospirillaceae bacterium]|nr:metallophosphoesterase [Rhodospirillaceae bacterium]MBT4490181.1 metallophosphoesterase [Rhodospirillaceae bacterium]MBT5194784.1 metallophosphoesterase [Rhodospirillaceae bacterium]MBT5899108.1 metallophosphoesterase [Rhodospirillaceae bacterium]MBT6429934.1 metallophosphoesterase [Rhodospirillaceae bacterium]